MIFKIEGLNVGIANDHAGYDLKVFLAGFLKDNGFSVYDYGCYNSSSVDYPDFAHALASHVNNGTVDWGISICGSGNGINMTVNKHALIRAALCWNTEIAELARLHNDANICSLPARFITNEQAMEIITAFMQTDFEGGRHSVRVAKIPL